METYPGSTESSNKMSRTPYDKMAKIKENVKSSKKKKTNYIRGNLQDHSAALQRTKVLERSGTIYYMMKGKVCSYEIYQKG